MMLIDPRQWFADPLVKPWSRTFRADLLATDTPTDGSGRFIIADFKPSTGQVVIVKAMFPFAQERTNVATPAETFRMLNPIDANGWFAYEMLIDGQSAIDSKTDQNRPRTAAGAVNSDRQVSSGFTWISSDPWTDAQKVWNPMFAVHVPDSARLTVVFTLLPAAVVTPIPNVFAVGGALQRVDFAGVLFTGVQMAAQTYATLAEDARKHNTGI